MFDKALRKSVEPYLQEGEQVLNVSFAQGKGMMKVLVAGGAIGGAVAGARRDRQASGDQADDADEGAVKLSSKMGIAITDRRLLIFRAGGAWTAKAKELITEVPIHEVDSLEVGKGAISKPLTFTVRGEAFHVEVPKATNTDKIVKALDDAKRRVAA